MTPSKEIDPPSHRRACGASSTGSCAIYGNRVPMCLCDISCYIGIFYLIVYFINLHCFY